MTNVVRTENHPNFPNKCGSCLSEPHPRWKCSVCPYFYLCSSCVVDRHASDMHCSQFLFHHEFSEMNRIYFLKDDCDIPACKTIRPPCVRRSKSDNKLSSYFVSHLGLESPERSSSKRMTFDDTLCEFSQNSVYDFNLPLPTEENPGSIVIPVEEFMDRIQRHVTVLQKHIGRLSPLIYHHPSNPSVISCACFKLKSITRFRHEFIALTFSYLNQQYRVQFDRGWRSPGRIMSWRWISGKPSNNCATVSFASSPLNMDEMDEIGRIVFRVDRQPLLIRASKHVSEVFGDGPSYFLFTWNCWLFARVAFMRAMDLSPSQATWRDSDLDGQNLMHKITLAEQSIAPWLDRLLSSPKWLQLISPIFGIRLTLHSMKWVQRNKLYYLRYFLATFTMNSMCDFVTGNELPRGAPHRFGKNGLAERTDDVNISRLCASLSETTPGRFLYLLTPALRPSRRRRIKRIEMMYSCNVTGGDIRASEVVEVGVIKEGSLSTDTQTVQRLDPIRELWSYSSTLSLGNPMLDSLESGGHIAMWVNASAASRVSIFHAFVKICY